MMDRIYLAQDGDKWQVFVSAAMNFGFFFNISRISEFTKEMLVPVGGF